MEIEDLRKYTDPEIFAEAQRRAKALAEVEKEKEQAKVEHECTCDTCGILTTVPFKPSPNYPVYCRDCYHKQREAKNNAPR